MGFVRDKPVHRVGIDSRVGGRSVDAAHERFEHELMGDARGADTTMNAREYWKVIRRKWPVIVATSLAAAVVMFLITPAEPPPVERVTSYTATATLIVETPARSVDEPAGAVSLDRVVLYMTTGEVPALAAQQVGYTREPALLANQLTVTPNPSAQSLTVEMSGADAEYVAAVANAFAEQSVAYFATPRDGTGEAELSILAEATPIPIIASGGFSIPPSRTFRTTMAALLGLLIGFGLALVLHQVDSRLRTRDEVYQALRMPVIAEIPKLSRSQREQRQILVADEPHGVYADGYRTARAAVMHTASLEVGRSESALAERRRARQGHAKVVMVTSAQAGEGKSTSVANLAASFAETGKSVLVLDADLRSPNLHPMFDVPQGAGISDFLYDPASTRLEALARPTSVPGVKIITAGTQLAHPASLATRMGTLIDEARPLADIVIVDTAPILAASDGFDILPIVDTVLFVVRSGRLTEAAGLRVSELLGRFHVPVTGAILVGTPSRRSDGYGYGYGSASEDPAAKASGRRGRRGARAAGDQPRPRTRREAKERAADGGLSSADLSSGSAEDAFDPYEGYDVRRDLATTDDSGDPPVLGQTRRQRRASSG
ncbi:P-loop NTPase [Nostocoides sp. F2B08]|uniref:polysaccharide biosynthesis tyrosine autokinase n=1 Tax=Nostocoides sp. F2B08 TaxID=2653936 RepID=UPI001263A7A0|nr:P-loop NTPase [Tetrasphaera sp. F2B08]